MNSVKHIQKNIYEKTKIKRNDNRNSVTLSVIFALVYFLPEKKDKKKYRNKIHLSLVNSKTSIDKLLESNKSFYTANMLTLLYPLIRAQQFARTVTSVHVTYTQRGFHVQEITCTRINHNIFK